MPLLGAHQSIAGGLHLAFDRIDQVGGESLQIFTANQRRWNSPQLQADEIRRFQQRWQESGNMPVASHASYLINLAAVDPKKAGKAVAAFVDELQRCQLLGIPYVVIHPGSHGGIGVGAGLEQVVTNLDSALEQTRLSAPSPVVLLETTAGQGTSLGSRFEELGRILGESRFASRLGVCFDTCHVFAAGYSLAPAEDYVRTFAEFEAHIGCDHLHFFHLNDSLKPCGSRIDRHAHIGEGMIGLEGFRRLLNDPRFREHPMTLETDKGADLAEDIENLRRLRELID
ncbi:MAG: deoxyribonuclease IV [Desulfobulbus sp.]|nr:deoxyribonuclease IV [Desulfobulbus sp.]